MLLCQCRPRAWQSLWPGAPIVWACEWQWGLVEPARALPGCLTHVREYLKDSSELMGSWEQCGVRDEGQRSPHVCGVCWRGARSQGGAGPAGVQGLRVWPAVGMGELLNGPWKRLFLLAVPGEHGLAVAGPALAARPNLSRYRKKLVALFPRGMEGRLAVQGS